MVVFPKRNYYNIFLNPNTPLNYIYEEKGIKMNFHISSKKKKNEISMSFLHTHTHIQKKKM